jgi:hypothetical protein
MLVLSIIENASESIILNFITVAASTSGLSSYYLEVSDKMGCHLQG